MTMAGLAVEDSDEESGSGSGSDDGSSGQNELPFLARASVIGVRASQDKTCGEDKPAKLNRESQAGPMELPEAVEAITGMDASYLPVCDHLMLDMYLNLCSRGSPSL